MRESGLDSELASLDHIVWVGLSAGSMVATPRIGRDFVGWTPPGIDNQTEGIDTTLGWVNFSLFPHLNHPELPHNRMANAQQWASTIGFPSYAIDDEAAIVVDNGRVDVVSEGEWTFFP